jgi:chaperone required for assembly of F1-ATPase
MAEAVAEEWIAQGDFVDPASMPVTRAANAAIDKVMPQKGGVVAALAAYGETDLLCYRAEGPDTLTMRQSAGWDPLLDWAHEAFGARLIPVVGVMPQPQNPAALARLTSEVARMDAFELTGFHDLVMLSGSLVLALAVSHGRLPVDEAWDLSRIDEEWQADLWGRDEEAEEAAAIRRDAFLAAERFVWLSRPEVPGT